MTRQDLIIATIRTAVPGAIGYLIAQLIAAIPVVADWIVIVDGVLAESAPGIDVVYILNALGVAAVVAAYYWIARELGRRFPFLERWLLGRSATPSYDGGASLEVPITDFEPKHRA